MEKGNVEKLTQDDFIAKIKEEEVGSEYVKKWGELGPVYGRQWRKWKASDGREIDQLRWALWKAKEYSELFTGDIQDISLIDNRRKFNFEIEDIVCKLNEAFEVQEELI